MKVFSIIPALILALGACSTAPGSDAGGSATIAKFNTDGKFEASSFELQDLGWEVTQPAAPAWVGLADADPAPLKTPGAGSKIMKLDFWDKASPSAQHSTRGFTMQRKVTITEAGTYTFRFKYQGKGFADAIKVAFDSDEKTVPTKDWTAGTNAGWEWNSTSGAPNKEDYERFNGADISAADFTLEAKTYTVKFSITGTYTATEWGYIDGLEIVKKTVVPPASTSKTLAEFKTMGSFEFNPYTLTDAGWTVENEGGNGGLFLDGSSDVITGTRSMKLYSDDASINAVAGFVMSAKVNIPATGDYLVKFKLRGKTWYYGNEGGAIKISMNATTKTAALSGDEVWKPNSETVSTEFTALATGEYTFKLSVDLAAGKAAFGRLDDLEIIKK